MKHAPTEIHIDNKHIVMPGMATSHSHAFQRALRGRTQRKPTSASSFWSWRGLMYELVARLNPEDIYHISKMAFVELAMSGVTAVGEFHYLHHQPDGTPYQDRTLLAETVIRAARDAGIRITLIRTAYFRGGHLQALDPAQKRFADPDTDLVLRDVEQLSQRFSDDDHVNVAVAAHSIRAVHINQVKELADFARQKNLPFHMHVCEQKRELIESSREYGMTPVALLSKNDILGENFVAVHATHLSREEIEALGQTKSSVCLCRTTERDLGDGLAPTSELMAAGAHICVGVDSHASSDAFEEVRAVELDERSRTQSRTVAAESPDLLNMATQNGFRANGIPDNWQMDEVRLRADDPAIAGADERLLSDMVVFGATPRAVDTVMVAGRQIVVDGKHIELETTLTNYKKTLQELHLA